LFGRAATKRPERTPVSASGPTTFLSSVPVVVGAAAGDAERPEERKYQASATQMIRAKSSHSHPSPRPFRSMRI
jgi:hypothetical protein